MGEGQLWGRGRGHTKFDEPIIPYEGMHAYSNLQLTQPHIIIVTLGGGGCASYTCRAPLSICLALRNVLAA